MSFRSTLSSPRLGNLGVFSVGVIAFALATLQGCAPSVTGSSALEPGAAVPGLGSPRADERPRPEARHDADRPVAERHAAQHARDRGTLRMDNCRRCGTN